MIKIFLLLAEYFYAFLLKIKILVKKLQIAAPEDLMHGHSHAVKWQADCPMPMLGLAWISSYK